MEYGKVWISKYALGQGIFQRQAEIHSDGVCKPVNLGWISKSCWHKTKEEAIARAEEMRKAKIASLKKQLEKLENLRFE